MSDMVERVALAIEGALPNQMKHLGPILARAAIAAMREPTEAMLHTGMDATDWPICGGEVEHRWQAMIDEALKS